MPDNDSKPDATVAKIGCYMGIAVALALLGVGLEMTASGSSAPGPLKVALLLTGLIEAAACFLALRFNRVGWSFAVALNGAMTLVFFFGAPSVSEGWGTSIAVGGIPFVLCLVTTVLLWLGSDNY